MSWDVDTAQLRTLVAVVDEGTLEAAARRLHITPSAVSQRLRALESATGRVLVRRAKPVTPTPAGEPVLRLARQVAVLLDEVAAAPGGEQARPVLPLAINADSLATWVVPALAPLAEDVRLVLHSLDQSRTGDLLRDGTVMGAVTSDAEPVAGCRVTYLGAMRYLPAAAPAFAGRWLPRGPRPEDLRRAPVVVFDRLDHLQHDYLRARLGTAEGVPVHQVPSTEAFRTAVALGLGWGLLPEPQLAATGADDLVFFDPAGSVDVPLHWQQWRLRSPGLDLVAAALVAAAGRALRR